MNKILLIISLLFPLLASAQDKGDELFAQGEYRDAVLRLNKDLSKDTSNATIRYKLAKSYQALKEYDQAMEHFDHLIRYDNTESFTDQDWHDVGHMYLIRGEKGSAIEAFENIKVLHEKLTILQLPLVKYFYEVEPLEKLNTEYSEFSPTSFNEKLLITSDRPRSGFDNREYEWSGFSYFSVFEVKDPRKRAGVKLLNREVNDRFHSGPVVFDEQSGLFVYTKVVRDKRADVHRPKLFQTYYKDGKWSDSEIIFGESGEFSVQHPAYVPETGMLIFASDMPGGLGGMDLYYSFKEEGGWSVPVNFGSKVNTAFDEVFPTYDKHSDAIYFSSDGRFGNGELDVYKLKLESGAVSTVTIMPRDINSPYDDFGIYFDSDSSGFVSSNRPGGKGHDDIYSFQLKKISFSGHVFDKLSGEPVAGLKLMVMDDDNLSLDSAFTDTAGFFNISRLPYQEGMRLGVMNEDDANLSIENASSQSDEDSDMKMYVLNGQMDALDSLPVDDDDLLTLYVSATPDKKSCIVYDNGDKAVRVEMVVYSKEGEAIDTVLTDDEGCIVHKKLYPDETFLALASADDDELEFQVPGVDRESSKNKHKLLEEELITLKQIDAEDPEAIYGIEGVVKELRNHRELAGIPIRMIGEDGYLLASTVTDDKGFFYMSELPHEESAMLMVDYDDMELDGIEGIEVSGTINPVENYAVDESKKRIYLVDYDNEKFASNDIDQNGNYSIEFEMESYQKASMVKDTSHWDVMHEQQRDTTVAENIYFELNSFLLTLESEKILDKVASFLRNNPEAEITIHAHTDSRGSESFNLNLSKQRAKSVHDYLVAKGIEDGRLRNDGHGESQLINECDDGVDCTEEEHALNRRTEFEVEWK